MEEIQENNDFNNFTTKDLFEAGVHYGHSRLRWNPKMAPYIYGVRNGIHIIDIRKTHPLLKEALTEINKVAAKNGRILFVGTKFNASSIIKETALECGQYYINQRWLGGLLTNWKTIVQSIKRLNLYEKQLKKPEGLTKKEILNLQRKYDKLEDAIGGIRKMGGMPDIVIVIDCVKEKTAIQEARKIGVPIVGILDSNANPNNIDYKIPGNDDAIKSIKMYCELFKKAILAGLEKNIREKGIDIGELDEAPETMNSKNKLEEDLA